LRFQKKGVCAVKLSVTNKKTAVSRGKRAVEKIDKPAAMEIEQASGASLEKVRDILFGVQMRDYDKRFARLEERLAKDIADLKEDLKKRLAALEGYAKKEVESLEDRIKAEQDSRTEQIRDVSREIKDNAKAFDKKTSSLDEQLAKSQKDLRQQLLDLNKQLASEIREKAEEILAAMDKEIQELRTEKADRTALASLFTEVAMRLKNEFKLPETEKTNNG
jgi:vacuolar-type H+-ATPase subunit I/STV1